MVNENTNTDLCCPQCGKSHTSHNIYRGCYQYWCDTCQRPYEGSVVDYADMAACEYADYVD